MEPFTQLGGLKWLTVADSSNSTTPCIILENIHLFLLFMKKGERNIHRHTSKEMKEEKQMTEKQPANESAMIAAKMGMKAKVPLT